MKYDGLSESQKEESSWEDNALKVQRISDAEKKDTDGASKPLQKSLSHTSPFSSAPSFNLLLPLQLLPPPSLSSPPLPSCAPVDGVLLSLPLPLIQAEPWTQAEAVCESVCESVCAWSRSGERVCRIPYWNSTSPTNTEPHSPVLPTSVRERIPEEYTFTPTTGETPPTWSHVNPRLLSHLGSDFGLPPWGEAPGAGSFEVRRDSKDLGYPSGKHFALGTVGCKPPWAGGQRSSTMDYLVGIFLLLCGVALPGRVAPQHTKDNVPRLKLSYKGKFCNQTHLYFVMRTLYYLF